MALCVQLDRNCNQLRFEEFATSAPLTYLENDPQDDSCVRVEATDVRTAQKVSVFLKTIDLQNIGISLTVWKNLSSDPKELSALIRTASTIGYLLQRVIPAVTEHLAPQQRAFFENPAYISRLVCLASYCRKRHPKVEGAPGMYLHFDDLGAFANVFANLKDTPPQGVGTYGKIRKALWINAPEGKSPIVAKKVLKADALEFAPYFEREMAAMREFSGKRGIISLIASGFFDDKHAIFMPLYQSDLWNCLKQRRFPLSLDEILSAASQWLEGLNRLSADGVHSDLAPGNLFLRRGKDGIEAVIGDLGGYRPYSDVRYGLTTVHVGSPEYYAKKMVTSKLDVWSMGINFLETISEEWLPCWDLRTEDEMASWTSKLTPGWALKYRTRADAPPFFLKLINEMLNPDVAQRPSAKEAFRRFSTGYASYVKK